MKSFTRILLVSLVVVLSLALVAGGISAQDEIVELPGLVGDWESVSCEHRPPADQPTYLKREVTFEDGNIFITFHQYADSFCTEPTFTFGFDGTYEIVGESDVAEGPVESIITITEVSITPDSDGMVGFFNSAEPGTCGGNEWEIGVEQSVTATGCSVFGLPADSVTTEYELFHITDDSYLFFAARPLDGTFLDSEDKRPGALLVPLMRVG